MQAADWPIVTTGTTTVYESPWWTVEEHAVIDVDGSPGMYNVLRCGDGVTVLEETGLTAESWTSLGLVHPYPPTSSAVHLFHARDARTVQAPEPGIELVRTSTTKLRGLIAGNEITHAASLVCLLTHLAGGRPAD